MQIAPGPIKSETLVRTAGLNETVQLPWGQGGVQWVRPLLLLAMDRSRFRATVRIQVRAPVLGLELGPSLLFSLGLGLELILELCRTIVGL